MSEKDILEIIQSDVAMIKKCLYGNNNPGQGLTDRLSVVENQLRWMMRMGIVIIHQWQ